MSEQFAGFPSPTKNWFMMPNNWTDVCAKIDSLAEMKVIEYVLRHTWGYQEYGIYKTISTNEFMHGRMRKDHTRMDAGTGLSESGVKEGLRKAIEDGYLVCEVDESDLGRTRKSYAVKMDGGGLISTPSQNNPVAKQPPGGLISTLDQRKKPKKETSLSSEASPSQQQSSSEKASAQLSTSNSKNVDNSGGDARNPIAEGATRNDAPIPSQLILVEKPKIPVMPPATTLLSAEKLVQITEALRGKYYPDAERGRQLTYAKKIIAVGVNEERYILAYHDCDTEWWRENIGPVHVETLGGNTPRRKMRVLELLEKIDLKTEAPSRNHLKVVPANSKGKRTGPVLSNYTPEMDTPEAKADRLARNRANHEKLLKMKEKKLQEEQKRKVM